MEHVTQSWQIVFLAALGVVAFVVLYAWFYRGIRGGEREDVSAGAVFRAVLDWRPVSRSDEGVPELMSRTVWAPSVEAVSSQDGRTDEAPDNWTPSRDDLLTLYKILRAHGVGREEIRPALKAVRVPLSNDLWKQAAPPAPPEPHEDSHVTPIAERPTKAAFQE